MEREYFGYDGKWRSKIMCKKTKDLNYNNRKEALEIVNRFKEKYLNGNIQELQDFCFWDILTDEDFNTEHDETKFDGDRTKIVYAIDYLLYYKKGLPDFSLGDKAKYSGDTICTFNTLFGSLPLRKYVTSKFNFSAKELLQREQFFRHYQTIGNFYILPNETIKIGKKNRSLNTYRGTESKWYDYFDIFLKNLQQCLTPPENTYDEKFKQLLELNSFYFKENKSFDSFITDFYLDDYNVLSFEGSNKYYHWNKQMSSNEEQKNEYKKFAMDYIEKASTFIKQRSTKIVNELKEIIQN